MHSAGKRCHHEARGHTSGHIAGRRVNGGAVDGPLSGAKASLRANPSGAAAVSGGSRPISEVRFPAGAVPRPGPTRRASAPCRLQPRADAVVTHHGAGATTVVGARDSAACATASSDPAQPPATPGRLGRARCGEVRAPTSRTPKAQRRGRRSPAGAISGAPRSGPQGSARAPRFVVILAAVV